MNKIIIGLSICSTFLLFIQCKKESYGLIARGQEIELGRKIDSIIVNSPLEYPIFDTGEYHNAYAYVDTMIQEILNSEYISRKSAFNYQIRIINIDKLYSFACPGGNLYFYTGLINYLDNGAQFAGFLAHEIAHIDRRHITKDLELKYHIDPLIEVIWQNNPALLTEITGYLADGLNNGGFSSTQEYEADEYAVKYTSGTGYDSRGIADFFAKLEMAKQGDYIPEFLIIHPDPGNRTERINKIWTEVDSLERGLFKKEYDNFKLSLIEK